MRGPHSRPLFAPADLTRITSPPSLAPQTGSPTPRDRTGGCLCLVMRWSREPNVARQHSTLHRKTLHDAPSFHRRWRRLLALLSFPLHWPSQGRGRANAREPRNAPLPTRANTPQLAEPPSTWPSTPLWAVESARRMRAGSQFTPPYTRAGVGRGHKRASGSCNRQPSRGRPSALPLAPQPSASAPRMRPRKQSAAAPYICDNFCTGSACRRTMDGPEICRRVLAWCLDLSGGRQALVRRERRGDEQSRHFSLPGYLHRFPGTHGAEHFCGLAAQFPIAYRPHVTPPRSAARVGQADVPRAVSAAGPSRGRASADTATRSPNSPPARRARALRNSI